MWTYLITQNLCRIKADLGKKKKNEKKSVSTNMASREWPELWSVSTDCQTVTVLVLHMKTHIHSMLVGLGNTALAVSVPIPRSGDPNFPQGINEADKKKEV